MIFEELYCSITLHNVMQIMAQLAFRKGQDSVFYGSPSSDGDKTDYDAVKRYLETSNCFTELTASDIDFFIKTLKEAYK